MSRMHQYIAALLCLLVAQVAAASGEPFAASVKSPAFTLRVPDFENFKLGPHPNNPSGQWLLGSNKDGVTVSVITHAIRNNETAEQCASLVAASVVQRFLPRLDQLRITKVGDGVYTLVFSSALGGLEQLKAYVVSGTGKGHCIEVHMSRLDATTEQRDRWMSGFKSVSIELQ